MQKPITIRDIQIIMTQPGPPSQRAMVVKILTSEPELVGYGCATFTQRPFPVQAAVERHLTPLLTGRDVSRIEEIWQLSMNHAYWRNGPVLNNAISGVDQALWDIKGKLAGMPLYDLLGGKVREAAHVYVHADGNSPEEVADNVRAFMEQGYRFIRIQMGGYGGQQATRHSPERLPPGRYFDPRAYARDMLKMIEHVRSEVGPEVELLHDVHERLPPINAVQFAVDVEPYHLYFLEDILAPEDIGWFEHVRQRTSTPLAMGELFNNPNEWLPLIKNRLIDFLRMHISQMGGISPARKVAAMAEAFGIRTAWHGPGDTSPVGHAANLHLDLVTPNFGVQEWCRFPEIYYEIFPGTPQARDGYLYANDQPGLGISVNETLAARFPITDHVEEWTQARNPDGTPARP